MASRDHRNRGRAPEWSYHDDDEYSPRRPRHGRQASYNSDDYGYMEPDRSYASPPPRRGQPVPEYESPSPPPRRDRDRDHDRHRPRDSDRRDRDRDRDRDIDRDRDRGYNRRSRHSPSPPPAHSRHRSLDVSPRRAPRRRNDSYYDDDDNYRAPPRRHGTEKAPRGGSNYYPPRAGARDGRQKRNDPGRGRDPRRDSWSLDRHDSDERERGSSRARPQRSQSASDAGREKMLAAGSAALAAGAAEAWKMRKDKGTWAQKGIKLATAAGGAAAIAAFQNGGGDDKKNNNEGSGKGDMMKSMLGGMLMNRFASAMTKK